MLQSEVVMLTTIQHVFLVVCSVLVLRYWR